MIIKKRKKSLYLKIINLTRKLFQIAKLMISNNYITNKYG
jgi:hypothetical protein